ncbi:helix-turn-helix domain-containing protein [Paenibacillus cymbidii]|uniref:helix-turn-helix domain-containing protein n=1 Tax=Paenibacillus cymbidii TaxID=1639034 RepID=UPI001081CED4|nr:AraC family transcriptional regulator [Paenibacillus cymbidii]
MEIYNEKIQFESPFLNIKVFEATRTSMGVGRWHYHKEIEILAILDGSLDVYVDDELYTLHQGDVVLIGSSQLHRDRMHAGDRMQYIVFQFDLHDWIDQSALPYFRFFAESDFPLSGLNYIVFENEAARRTILACVEDILAETQRKEDGYEIAVSLQIKKIILTLLRGDTRKLLSFRDNAELLRMRPVLDYIEQNLTQKLQVEEASRVANVSYHYFVKYFKKVIGLTFLEYVNYKKIKRAERLLMTSDISIVEVGEAVGLPNMAHFYKTFKRYNDCSPSEFRKKRYALTR